MADAAEQEMQNLNEQGRANPANNPASDVFGTDPPSKVLNVIDMVAIVLFYIGLDIGVSTLMFIKNVKNNWPYYKCQTNYMLFSWFFGYDTETNFKQCMQNMQSGYMTVLMQPANYLMSLTTSSISGLSSSLNDVRNFMSNFRTNVSDGVSNIFGVFLNMLVQLRLMMITIKDMIGKNTGILTASLYTMDTSNKAMTSTWAGPIGQMVRAL